MQTEKEESFNSFPRKEDNAMAQGEGNWRRLPAGVSPTNQSRDTTCSSAKRRPNIDLKIRIPGNTTESTHSWSSPIGEGRIGSSGVARTEAENGERRSDSKSEQQEGSCSSPYLSDLGRFSSSTALRSWSNDRSTDRRTASAKDWEANSPVLTEEPKIYSASHLFKKGRARSPLRTNSASDSVAANENYSNTTTVNNDTEPRYRVRTDESVDRIVSDESERNSSKLTTSSVPKHRRQGSGTSISSRKTLTEHSPHNNNSNNNGNNETNNVDYWISVVQERKRQASEIKSAFDELARDLEYFRKAREEDDSYLTVVRERLESMDVVSSEKAAHCDKLMNELAQIDSEMAKLEENVAEYSKVAAKEETQRFGAAKAMSLLENHLKALNAAIEAENILAEALERRLQVAKTGISLFSGPDAKQRYEVALKTIEEDSANLRAAQDRCNHAREELKRLKEQRDLIIPVIERAEQMKKECREAESEAQYLEQEVSKLRQELQNLDENFDSLDRVLEEYEFRSSQARNRIATASKLKEKLVSDCASKMKLLEVLNDQCEEIRLQASNNERNLSQMEAYNANMESALAQANEAIAALSKAIAESRNSSRNTSVSKAASTSSSDPAVTYSLYNSTEPSNVVKSQRKRGQSPTKPPKPPRSSGSPSHSTQEGSVADTDEGERHVSEGNVKSKPENDLDTIHSPTASFNRLDMESPLIQEQEAAGNAQVSTIQKKGDDRAGGTGADFLRSFGTTRSMNGVLDRIEPASTHHKSTSLREQASVSGGSSSVRGSVVNTISSDWAYPLSSTTRNEEQRKQSSLTSPPYSSTEHANGSKNVETLGDEVSQTGGEVSWERVYIHGEFYNSRTLFASPFENIREAELYMDRDRVSNNVIIGWYRLPRGSNMIDRTALRNVGMQYVTTADDIGHRLVVEIQLKESSKYNSHIKEGERPNAVTDIISTDPEMDRKVSQWVSEGQKAFLVEDELTGERRGIFLSSTKLKVQKQASQDRNSNHGVNTSSTSSAVDDVGGIWITEEKKSWAADPTIRLDDMDPLSFQLTLTHTFVFRAATSEQRDLIAICIRRFYSRFFALQRTRKVNCQFQ